MKSRSELPSAGTPESRKLLTQSSLSAHELSFDKERARKLLGIIYERFLGKADGGARFIAEHAPQWKYRPRTIEFGSPEHELWLWHAAATDLRTESENVYHAHQLLWENKKHQLPFGIPLRPTRELYARAVLDWTFHDYSWALSKCGFGNPKRSVEWWPRRAETLWNSWNGDPFVMFAFGTINALMAWKCSERNDPLPGVGPKIASLIAIFFEELGMAPVPDAFPVDVHVQRLALALRLVVPLRNAPILNETMEALLRPAIVELCREEGWSRIALSHALWFRGNRGCTNCWKTPYMQTECPVFTECQGAYASRPYFKMGLWLPMAGPMGRGGKAPMVPFYERSLFFKSA